MIKVASKAKADEMFRGNWIVRHFNYEAVLDLKAFKLRFAVTTLFFVFAFIVVSVE